MQLQVLSINIMNFRYFFYIFYIFLFLKFLYEKEENVCEELCDCISYVVKLKQGKKNQDVVDIWIIL